MKGFGPNKPSPTLTDYSSSQGAVSYGGDDDQIYYPGSKSQDNMETGPSTWSQQSSDSDGGSNSNDDFYLNAGNTGWAQNGGQDSGAYDPIPYRAEGDSEDVEEGPVWSDVSDLEPVYSFSSKSSYQHGRHVSIRTSYTPGDYAMPASNDEPVVPEWPGKGSPKVGY
ncbi:hypothetical protein NHX12_013527 [Muraenolepis orangiensis]|uniref:Uncharacterized protein n=1 Tax=Muraenolepis orangiensis TaxID=630683 RepID=A0A9Q0DF39_9TELE|nr:hypothetical protein NHX12_013527 [Muraenolepis orangiensis]